MEDHWWAHQWGLGLKRLPNPLDFEWYIWMTMSGATYSIEVLCGGVRWRGQGPHPGAHCNVVGDMGREGSREVSSDLRRKRSSIEILCFFNNPAEMGMLLYFGSDALATARQIYGSIHLQR
jgi:hypothetical protein